LPSGKSLPSARSLFSTEYILCPAKAPLELFALADFLRICGGGAFAHIPKFPEKPS